MKTSILYLPYLTMFHPKESQNGHKIDRGTFFLGHYVPITFGFIQVKHSVIVSDFLDDI